MSNTKPAPKTPDLPGDDVMYAHIEHITPLPIERPAQPQAEPDSAAASGEPSTDAIELALVLAKLRLVEADRDRLQRENEHLRACLVDKKEHQHDGK